MAGPGKPPASSSSPSHTTTTTTPPSTSTSTSTSTPSTSTPTSYIDMTEVDRRPDASLVGQHCQYEYCRQLDFLPFFCQSCRQTFCLDHRTESAHRCRAAGAWAARQRQAQLARPSAGAGRAVRDRDVAAAKPCATPGCPTVVGTSLVPGVHCAACRRDYCLKHRLREDHRCGVGAGTGAGAGDSSGDTPARAKTALDKLRAWGAAKKEQANKALPRAQTTAAAARAQTAALATLKAAAKGDGKIPADKRLYLHVEAEAASTRAQLPRGRFFYHRDWAAGRVLDAAARHLQVANVNNQSAREEDKLRLFHVEGGRLLDFGETAGAALAHGNTIVLLRGVGPPPEMIGL